MERGQAPRSFFVLSIIFLSHGQKFSAFLAEESSNLPSILNHPLLNMPARRGNSQTQKRRKDREIEADGRLLPVRVTEIPVARRMTLRIVPGGRELQLTIPHHVANSEVDAFLARNRNWVAARISRLPPATAIAQDAVIPFRGQPHRIVCTGSVRGVIETGRLRGERVLAVPGDPEYVGRRTVDFLRRTARREIDEAVDRHAGKLGVRPKSIRITDSRSRWGSCSETRTLSFSWRIIMAPPVALDYLTAHEVAHLKEMNHSAAFWRLVARLCPDMEAQKAWLRANTERLHSIVIE